MQNHTWRGSHLVPCRAWCLRDIGLIMADPWSLTLPRVYIYLSVWRLCCAVRSWRRCPRVSPPVCRPCTGWGHRVSRTPPTPGKNWSLEATFSNVSVQKIMIGSLGHSYSNTLVCNPKITLKMEPRQNGKGNFIIYTSAGRTVELCCSQLRSQKIRDHFGFNRS